jgi:hypothetical protein
VATRVSGCGDNAHAVGQLYARRRVPAPPPSVVRSIRSCPARAALHCARRAVASARSGRSWVRSVCRAAWAYGRTTPVGVGAAAPPACLAALHRAAYCSDARWRRLPYGCRPRFRRRCAPAAVSRSAVGPRAGGRWPCLPCGRRLPLDCCPPSVPPRAAAPPCPPYGRGGRLAEVAAAVLLPRRRPAALPPPCACPGAVRAPLPNCRSRGPFTAFRKTFGLVVPGLLSQPPEL